MHAFFLRFVLYIVVALPALLQLATVMGGLCFIVSGLIYLKAALSGEQWALCVEKATKSHTLTQLPPPSVAPPRFISTPHLDEDVNDVEPVQL